MIANDDKAEVLVALDTALRKFARLGGVKAPQLPVFVRYEGRILLFALDVALSTPDDQLEEEVAKALESHIVRLKIPPARRAPNAEKNFRNLARMHFTSLGYADSMQGTLKERRQRFATWTKYEVSYDTTNQWWPDVVSYLAESLWEGIPDALKPAVIELAKAGPEPEPAEAVTGEVTTSEVAGLNPDNAAPDDEVPPRLSIGKVDILILAAALVLVVAIIGDVAYRHIYDNPQKSPTKVAAPVISSTSQSPTASQAVPIAATVTYIPDGAHCDGWIFPGKSPSDLPAPASLSGLTGDWAHGLGGVDERFSRILVVIQGLSPTSVALKGLHITDLKVEKPLTGTVVDMGQGCGGVLTEQYYEVYLNNSLPQPQLMSSDEATAKVTVLDRPFLYTVSSTDPEPLNIQADAASIQGGQFTPCNCEVSWRLAVDWSSQDRQGTLIIDDHGKPFQTDWTLGSGGTDLLYNNGSWS